VNDDIIYLDHNATTPLDPRVLEAMMPYLTNLYANASSNHKFGHEVNDAMKQARRQIADLIGCDKHEIVFTSGATEAINLAIKGVAEKYANKGKHIITCQTEHKAVLDVCSYLEKHGYEVTYLGVDEFGLISLDELQNSIRPDTLLVSIMMANNETGVIHPITKISKIVKDQGALLMTDATQAFGKIPIDVNELGIDLMAFSGHKIYGPKGVGGLYVRQNRPFVKLEALVHGGGHERGFRSGTLNVPGIVGLGHAAEIAGKEMIAKRDHIKQLRDLLEQELLQIEGSKLNGHPENRLHTTCNILFEGVDADALMMKMDHVMISNGSACTSTEVYPSHVLKAMGRTDDEAYASIRISLGKDSKRHEIDAVILSVKSAVEQLRSFTLIR
jgi:cysteine desulfurase